MTRKQRHTVDKIFIAMGAARGREAIKDAEPFEQIGRLKMDLALLQLSLLNVDFLFRL